MINIRYEVIGGELYIPAVRKPNGYCVHKYKIDKGMLSKLELFGYFKQEVLEKILERTEELNIVKGTPYPPYFNQPGKYIKKHRAIIMWNKSPVLIKCYQSMANSPEFKLEVTRGRVRKVGKKFLQPISTLNSLGSLIRFLTGNATPISDLIHSDFSFVEEFLESCERQFLSFGRRGQLRLIKEQKLQENIQFGFKGK